MLKPCQPQTILAHLTTYSGVYQMFDLYGKILYIGKAKNLKNRVSQYFTKQELLPIKTQALMAKVCRVEVIVTQTETQALLLENNLIKTHKPKYNILLKDDKSYPYIYLSDDKHPKVGFYRGEKKAKGQYFGPFASAYLVKESLILLKKIFKVRQCANGVYANRSRPCLEYQLDLCSAPCVDKISLSDYTHDVQMMRLFLSGKNQETLTQISQKMQTASSELNFELAAHYRDQLKQLNAIQAQQQASNVNNSDVIAIASYEEILCIQILFIRNNRQVGQSQFFPNNPTGLELPDVLVAFLPLYYLDKERPKEMLVSHLLEDKILLENSLETKILHRVSGDKKQYLTSAVLSAKSKARQRHEQRFSNHNLLEKLQKLLQLPQLPMRMECFDISHMMGEATVASCVVFEAGKAKKSLYRQFNITGITGGDDYAAIKQVITRRYTRVKNEQEKNGNEQNLLPNLLIIDGGLGQLTQALGVVKTLELDIPVIGVAKGEKRKAGLETLIMISDQGEVLKIKLKPDDGVLMLINRIRDESHRFAISKHRNRMKKTRQTSVLEKIEGIGEKKRTAILNHFGGLQEVKAASIEELSKINGINKTLANNIYKSFRQL